MAEYHVAKAMGIEGVEPANMQEYEARIEALRVKANEWLAAHGFDPEFFGAYTWVSFWCRAMAAYSQEWDADGFAAYVELSVKDEFFTDGCGVWIRNELRQKFAA